MSTNWLGIGLIGVWLLPPLVVGCICAYRITLTLRQRRAAKYALPALLVFCWILSVLVFFIQFFTIVALPWIIAAISHTTNNRKGQEITVGDVLIGFVLGLLGCVGSAVLTAYIMLIAVLIFYPKLLY